MGVPTLRVPYFFFGGTWASADRAGFLRGSWVGVGGVMGFLYIRASLKGSIDMLGFRGSYKWSYKSPNIGYNYSYPTSNYP